MVAAPGCFLRASEGFPQLRLLCLGLRTEHTSMARQVLWALSRSPGVLSKARLSLAKISSSLNMK